VPARRSSGAVVFEEPLPYDDLAGYAAFADRRAFAAAQPDASWLGIEGFVRVAERFRWTGVRWPRTPGRPAWG
jgi:L-alanine-DL-glutamate epimerase-like enolase superfamily enzyme